MKRVLLKISGEALSNGDIKISPEKTEILAKMIAEIHCSGVELVVVLGGGNIYRGGVLTAHGVNPADSHNMSMLSTVFNGLTLKNFLEKEAIGVELLDALGVEFLERYTSLAAKKYIAEGKIVIASSGIGTPFFTTDTGSVIRALELQCEAVIKLTKVDGVYDKDPLKYPDALRFESISFDEFLQKDLKVFDQTGIILARDNHLPLYVSKLDDIEALKKIVEGGSAGSKIF